MSCIKTDRVNGKETSGVEEPGGGATDCTVSVTDCGQCQFGWHAQLYCTQERLHWPPEGKHILAQYDDDSVIVYQAYNPVIAEYAVKNQCFGGVHFSYDRMSWIKTNFLWMMYRCGWATKKGQEHVLAVRITREGFESILAHAYTAQHQNQEGLSKDDIMVRLQWDPDHSPTYEKCQRKAIQLGLKREILKKYGTEWIIHVKDITPFVKQQHRVLQTKGVDHLIVAKERVYNITNGALASKLSLDTCK